jgi:HEAT repeat protein
MARKAPSKKTKAPRGNPLVADWLAVAQRRGMTVTAPASPKTGQAIWKLLEDEHPSVRQAAGFALTAVRDAALVQAFIHALKGVTPKRVARAALALGEAGFSNAGPYFVAAFERKDKDYSAAMARALGLLAEGDALEPLSRALDNDFVPVEAAEALGRLNDPKAVPPLLRALKHKKDGVRSVAAYALGCLGGLSGEQERVVAEQLSALSDDASQRVRLCAAVARFERGDPNGLEAIRGALS